MPDRTSTKQVNFLCDKISVIERVSVFYSSLYGRSVRGSERVEKVSDIWHWNHVLIDFSQNLFESVSLDLEIGGFSLRERK